VTRSDAIAGILYGEPPEELIARLAAEEFRKPGEVR
jgi:hypothetical protein